MRVLQAFNGLGPAGRYFYDHLREKLKIMHATPMEKDPCLYELRASNIPNNIIGPLHPDARILISTHVDNFVTVNNITLW